MSEETDPRNFVKYLNTVLLSVIITIGGAFSVLMLNRSISQGETLAAIQSSQVSRSEMEAKVSAVQTILTASLATIQTDNNSIRAKLGELEIRQAALIREIK